jgi:hypothetical protein
MLVRSSTHVEPRSQAGVVGLLSQNREAAGSHYFSSDVEIKGAAVGVVAKFKPLIFVVYGRAIILHHVDSCRNIREV